jgi:3-deoxy-D-manno-octulosonic-acid transferase
MRRVLNLGEDEAVFVCGSTRGGEEPQILDAFERIRKAFPNTILVMAPRHIERAADVAREVERRGLGCQLRTRLDENGEERTAPVVILDTFGELFNLYSVATLVFCGASLVPLGGQNPLEPAAWGKPVLYGPSMEDFLDAKEFLEKEGADGLIHGPDMLAERTMQLLGDPAKRRDQGERARRAVLGNRDAAERHARVIVDLLTSSTR